MDPARLVWEAASSFNAGDSARFVRCFAQNATIYWEPEVADYPAIQDREQLETVLPRILTATPRPSVEVTRLSEFGKGLIADTIIETEDVWRLSLAVTFSAEEITEVRAFRDSREAEAWLSENI